MNILGIAPTQEPDEVIAAHTPMGFWKTTFAVCLGVLFAEIIGALLYLAVTR